MKEKLENLFLKCDVSHTFTRGVIFFFRHFIFFFKILSWYFWSYAFFFFNRNVDNTWTIVGYRKFFLEINLFAVLTKGLQIAYLQPISSHILILCFWRKGKWREGINRRAPRHLAPSKVGQSTSSCTHGCQKTHALLAPFLLPCLNRQPQLYAENDDVRS